LISRLAYITKNTISICFLSPDPPTPLNIIPYGTTNLYLDVSRKHFYEIILFGGTEILCCVYKKLKAV
jgi:hypothetical protein